MPRSLQLTVCLAAICLTQTVKAQEAPAFPQPQDEHKWLTKFVGHWDVSSTGSMGEGQPPMKMKGTIKSEMLGGFWVMNVMESEMMGMPFRGIQTIGYDTDKKKYVGTWVDSTNGFMWKYEGFVEESGRKLVLEAVGPDMMVPDKTRTYRDAYEFTDKGTVISTSSVKNDDGTWTTFMNGEAKRVDQKKDIQK